MKDKTEGPPIDKGIENGELKNGVIEKDYATSYYMKNSCKFSNSWEKN